MDDRNIISDAYRGAMAAINARVQVASGNSPEDQSIIQDIHREMARNARPPRLELEEVLTLVGCASVHEMEQRGLFGYLKFPQPLQQQPKWNMFTRQYVQPPHVWETAAVDRWREVFVSVADAVLKQEKRKR
jgi:hypothetical protein